MMKGYEALREAAAWIDLSGRGKIRLTGEDRARLLHAMTTNHIEQMKPGDSCYAFFLNAQGRILADVNILCESESFLLDTEPETRQKVFEHLDQFIIADDVTLEDVTDSLATIGIEGPSSAAAIAKLPADTIVIPNGSIGALVCVPVTEKDAFIARLSLPEADAEAARVVRLEHGQPRYGEEITERFLVQETGQMRAMHFSKGCYLGQEIVERVRSRGQVHRHLLPIQIDSQELPQPGTKLTADGKELAEVMSAAWSPALHKTVAMAYVRTDAAKPGFLLKLGEADAIVGVAV